MAVIGIDLQPDELVLQKGRDFKWAFENLNEAGGTEAYPAGDLYFELQTRGEHNARQRVRVVEASGGTYRLGVLGTLSAPIDFYDSVSNPHGMAGDITDALEAISTVGAGNVELTPAKLYPAWELNLAVNVGQTLTEPVVNLLNKNINEFFDNFEELLGVDVDLYVIDSTHARVSVTSLKSYEEDGLITFAVNVVGSAVKSFINGITGLIGLLDSVSVDFYWVHEFEVEFVNALGNQPIPAMATDITALTGVGGGARVEVEVLESGKHPLTLWEFSIAGYTASLKVESTEVDKILPRTKWQLVFLPTGEAAGGDPIARGTVTVQE
jgi:hypothetical protein